MKASRIKYKSFRSVTTATGGLLLSSILTLSAQTWLPTAAGTSYDWTSGGNWLGGTYATGSGATANINTDLAGSQTIRLRDNITLGTLNLGDALASGASFGFNIGNASGESYTLSFDSGSPGTAAQINLNSTGVPVNTISAGISLQSDLVVRLGGTDASNAQRITFSGALDLGTKTMTFKEGFYGASNQITINGTNSLKGSGTIVNDSNSVMTLLGMQTEFTGTIILNNRANNSNAGSLTMVGSNVSLLNAKEFVVNGYLTGGNSQMGGSVQVGNNAGTSTNPGQRLTKNTITLNGGSLLNTGQALSGDAFGGVVSDTVANLRFNSATSWLSLSSRSNSSTEMHVTTLQRSRGATGYLQSDGLGGASQLLVANAASHLVGAGGDAGSTTMSIIPWLVNVSSSNTYSFVTSTDTGIRQLSSTEYASSLSAGAGHNVSTNSTAALTSDATVNLLRFTSGSTLNLGADRTLTVAGGGVLFANTNGQIGASGSANAGTLNFGTAEGVVWTITNFTNTIGARITGSGGLSKAGPGTLVLTGQNEYSGLTYVGSGTLQVGDGTNAGNLGLSQEVIVASGATLKLKNADAFAEDVVLTLQGFGLSNGLLDLEVNQTVDKLIFGDVYQLAGTYGALGSGAMFESNQWFIGPGILTVNAIPEPSTYLFLGAGAGLMLWMRRSRSGRYRG